MNWKKVAMDAAVLKAVTEALEMAGRRRKPAAKKMKGISKTFGKTVEGIGATAGKTVEGISATAGKAVEGIGKTAGKTVEGLGTMVEELGATAGKTVGAFGEAVEKTVETTVHKTKDATVGKVAEARVQRTRAKIAKRRQKLRKQRMDNAGMWFGFGLIVALIYWWDQRRDKSMQGVASQAAHALKSAGAAVGRTAQEVAPKVGSATADAFRTAKETVTRKAQDIGSQAGSRASEQETQATEDAKRRLSAERGMESEGNGHGKVAGTSKGEKAGATPESTATPKSGPDSAGSTTSRAATTGTSGVTASSNEESNTGSSLDDLLAGRSEVSAPGELRGPSGPEISTGMKVVGFDGVDVGRVQEVEEDSFILNRPKGSDLRVPKDAVARVEGTVAYLRVGANRVVQQGWESTGSS